MQRDLASGARAQTAARAVPPALSTRAHEIDPRPAGTLTRRTLLGGALSLPAIALLAGCGNGAGGDEGTTAVAAPPPQGGYDDWASVRALFELEPGVSHLSLYILAAHPRPVRDAIARYRDGMDRNPHEYYASNQWRAEGRVLDAAARHLDSPRELIALTDSTTMGLGVVVGGMRLAPGDEILRTVHDHYAAAAAVRYAAERSGANVRTIALYPPAAPEQATVDGILDAVRSGLRLSTRLVLMTWVHSASGIRLPVREIAELVERANRGRPEDERALLAIDGAHGLGTGPETVADLGCDVLVAGCHKWLVGPRGTGVAWASEAAWARMTPAIPSFDGRLFEAFVEREPGSAPPGQTFTPGGYHSFEHRWALDEAFDLHARIGRGRIADRIAQLGDRLRQGMAATAAVRLHVPADERLRSGIVCFRVDGLDAAEVVARLYDEQRVSATVSPYPVRFARLGTCWPNTEEEVDAAVEAVRRIA